MILTGTWLFGSPSAGLWFMWIQGFTVFLALIGTTLACINTGARVTYAMGRDKEVGEFFGRRTWIKPAPPPRESGFSTVLSIFLGHRDGHDVPRRFHADHRSIQVQQYLV